MTFWCWTGFTAFIVVHKKKSFFLLLFYLQVFASFLKKLAKIIILHLWARMVYSSTVLGAKCILSSQKIAKNSEKTRKKGPKIGHFFFIQNWKMDFCLFPIFCNDFFGKKRDFLYNDLLICPILESVIQAPSTDGKMRAEIIMEGFTRVSIFRQK